MYRRAKFLEILLEIRQEMAHEADYDVELFAEIARHGSDASASLKGKKLTEPRVPRQSDPDPGPIRLDKGVAN